MRRTRTSAEHLSVVATGGYGRGELAPGADIVLLFVHPAKRNAWCESVIEFTLHMLWDLGLKVGHAARTLAECSRLAKSDSTIRTALLEARYVAGDRKLFEEMRANFRKESVDGPAFVQAKLAERDTRHTRQGASRYTGRAQHQGGQGRAARPADALLDRQISLPRRRHGRPRRAQRLHARRIRDVPEGESFLWDVRVRLHYLMGPQEERLSFDAPAGARRQHGLHRSRSAPRRREIHEGLFPRRKDVGRPDAHLLRPRWRSRTASPSPLCRGCFRIPQAARRRRGFLCRERTAERPRRRLRARSARPDLHLPHRRREERRRPSFGAAHHHPLARADRRRVARGRGSQPPVPRNPVVAPRSRACAAADERGPACSAASSRSSAASWR